MSTLLLNHLNIKNYRSECLSLSTFLAIILYSNGKETHLLFILVIPEQVDDHVLLNSYHQIHYHSI